MLKKLVFVFTVILLNACGGGTSSNNSPAGPAPVIPSNALPVINSFTTTTISAQGLVQFAWSVSDNDNDSLSCTINLPNALPATRTINNCLITQAATFQVAENAEFIATLTVSDGVGQTQRALQFAVDTLPNPSIPPTAETVMKIYYLHSSENYTGWGLHLWGQAIEPEMATTWQTPMPPTRVEDDYAYWEVPLQDPTEIFSFIVHFGDLKSPNYDLILRPSDFGYTAWVVEDNVAAVGEGITAIPFADETTAREVFTAFKAQQGNATASLDMSAVEPDAPASSRADDWYTNANFMEIYIRGYQDSDGDGVGDFNGLTSRLDYLADLGITALWLMPMMESADNDHGYETQNYRAVESDYGTLADFQQLIIEADRRGIAIIIDYVVNHAASQNPLFLDAASSVDHPLRDWFIWRDQIDNSWQLWGRTPWRSSPYGVYYGAFTERMPDFNLRNPAVLDYHINSMRFWLNLGVAGFRFDAVGVLIENGAGRLENQVENLAIMQTLRAGVADYSGVYIVCEAPGQFRAMASPNACGYAFNFAAGHAVLDSVKSGQVTTSLHNELNAVNHDQMPLILANHDAFAGIRIFDQLSGDEAEYKVAAATYLLASANPFTYYGEEIGMAGGLNLNGDQALRTPMSWTNNTLHAGFSNRTPFRALSRNVQTHNVEQAVQQSGSLLEFYNAIYTLRQAQPILSQGNLTVLSHAADAVLVFTRTEGERTVYVAINFASASRELNTDWLEGAQVLFSSTGDFTLSGQISGQSVWVWEN
ncbi:alpha-amylase family glycosyl hydrolase [Opacimonas viscosa]|uniref:Alpha-amylase family glycosyl hydrolase n=1 Tax=Opacimonas viscosa TaxID=2961944 RepID=A0AA41X0U2_9ALTE|nr:alpha-amylase family glycosyl hydrolase [Opacimonas viscosa]MCP3429660.1 alpha-amylase family glycosyl hydrolase [Opacimonas viscosa]